MNKILKDMVTDDIRKKYKLVVATPFYEVKAYSPYIESLFSSFILLNKLGLDYNYYQLSGDSYVDRAKNALVHRFLQSEATHLMMIDSDLSWNVEGFARILQSSLMGAEVIGGTYPNKNAWETFGVIPILTEDGFFVGKETQNMRVLEMKGIPGGFLIYSRKAFERTMPNVAITKDVGSDNEIFEFFKCSVERTDWVPKKREDYEGMNKEDLVDELVLAGKRGSGRKLGEDIYFQQRYREMGGRVWLEPNITFQHYGVKGWEGNFHDKHIIQVPKNDTN